MSEMPKRFLLRGRAASTEELEKQKLEAARRAAVTRQPGEGIHEYVRRVSAGALQIIRTDELNSILSDLSIAQSEITALRSRSDLASTARPLTAEQVMDRQRYEDARRLRYSGSSNSLGVFSLPRDTESRLMVGGPLDGRVLRLQVGTTTHMSRDTSPLGIVDATNLDSAAAQTASITRNVRYSYMGVVHGIPVMLVEDLLNASSSVLEQYVALAASTAGIPI